MVYQQTSEALRDEVARSSFDIGSYLLTRDNKQDFVMVEVGHSGSPVAYQQPEGFKGERAYIGLEAWMGAGKERGHKWIRDIIAKKAVSDNVFYMSYELGGQYHHEPQSYGPDKRWYEGSFDTKSLLPDSVADEVFASNVFCDPHISYHRDRTQELLSEMERMLNPWGVIVMRETITPGIVNEIDARMLDELGLCVLGLENGGESPLWEALEARYDGQGVPFDPIRSYYLFLGKKPVNSYQ